MNNKILTLLLALITHVACAQAVSFGNFKVAEQEIIYQKIFTLDSITTSKLEAYYKTLPYISNIESKSDGIQFDLTDINVDYKKFQYSQVNTNIVMQTGKYSGKVTVGVKDGKYRITIKAIQFTGNLGYKMITEKDNLTRYATKNSGTIMAEDWCRPNMLGLLDKAFTDKLELKKADDEW
jgi:hypothetical protein